MGMGMGVGMGNCMCVRMSWWMGTWCRSRAKGMDTEGAFKMAAGGKTVDKDADTGIRTDVCKDTWPWSAFH